MRPPIRIVDVSVLDVCNETVLPNRTVSIEGERIRWIGEGAETGELPQGETVIDGSGLTLLPGLIDCHVHLAHDGEPNWMTTPTRTTAEETLAVVRNAAATLAAGVTTVRDCGSGSVRAPLALSLRGSDESVLLPRVISCGSPITMTGGHLHWEAVEADGVDEIRKAVRSELKAGAQWIKIIATGGVLTPGTDIGSESYTREEIAAAVSEASRGGHRVAAHAIGGAGIKNALSAGVSSIEHGSYMDAEAIDLMCERAVYHVPTLSAYHQVVSRGIDGGIPPDSVAKAVSAYEANLASFAASLAAGVSIAAGTDAGTPHNAHGSLPLELELMVDGGATPLQAIRTATVQAAAALDLSHEIGDVAIGKRADLLLIEGDPLEDITRLSRPGLVIKDGSVAFSAMSQARSAPVAELRLGVS